MTLKNTGNGKVGLYSKDGPKTHALLYNFDIDGHSVKREHKEFLQTHVVPLLAQGGFTLLRGMSSRTGSDKHNDDLSKKRAEEVIHYLLQEAPATSQVFTYKGVGETEAEAAGQADNLEDEYYRAVSLIVSTERLPHQLPKKKEKPKPYPPKKMDWRNGKISLRAKILDIFVVKKISGELYLSPGICQTYVAWNLSVSNLSFTAPFKGKPPLWLGKLKAVGKKFSYNVEVFNPKDYWKDKTIDCNMSGTTITITIKNGLPRAPTANYQPLRGFGVTTRGKDVIFELQTDGVELGVVKGIGSIQKPTEHRPTNCA